MCYCEMHRDAIFVEDPSEFFRFSRNVRKDNVVPFIVLVLSALYLVWFSGIF